MARIARKEDFFDGVIIAVDSAMNDRLQRSLLRHGPKPGSNQDLFAELLAARFPALSIRTRSHGKVIVEGRRFKDTRRVRIRRIARGSRQDDKHAEQVS